MSDSGCSHVTMPAEKVQHLAQETLDWIKDYRIKRKQKEIEEHRQRKINGFFHKLFKRPVPSDEEIVKEMSDGFVNPFVFIDMAYEKSEDTARRLLNAAKHAKEINVSVQDLARIT